MKEWRAAWLLYDNCRSATACLRTIGYHLLLRDICDLFDIYLMMTTSSLFSL